MMIYVRWCWINTYSCPPWMDSWMTSGVEINISGGQNTRNVLYMESMLGGTEDGWSYLMK